MTTILIVGAADTGRAPIAAALLQRLLDTQYPGARAESAGVLGHDGDPAEVEARDTMLHMGIDLSGHRARSVDDALAAAAALLLAIDSGTALVLRGRVRQVPWYSFFDWGWRSPRLWWNAWRQEGPEWTAPTALVDLAKPAFKLGVAAVGQLDEDVDRAGHLAIVAVEQRRIGQEGDAGAVGPLQER